MRVFPPAQGMGLPRVSRRSKSEIAGTPITVLKGLLRLNVPRVKTISMEDGTRPTLVELIDSDASKMTKEELRLYIAHLKAWRNKDFPQMVSDEFEGNPEHEGFIYIFSHDAMPGILKIGCTSRPVGKRAAEIAKPTGVPGAFKIEKQFPVYARLLSVEKHVHDLLGPYRFVNNREFFRISIEEATRVVKAACDVKVILS